MKGSKEFKGGRKGREQRRTKARRLGALEGCNKNERTEKEGMQSRMRLGFK